MYIIREFKNYNQVEYVESRIQELKDMVDNLEDFTFSSELHVHNGVITISITVQDKEFEISYSNDGTLRYDGKEIGISSIDDGLNRIETEIKNIAGLDENLGYDSSITLDQVSAIEPKIKKIQSRFDNYNKELDMSHQQVNQIVENLEDRLRGFDEIVSEYIIDLLIFDIWTDNVPNEIIELGDKIIERYGTEPKMVMDAFEIAFDYLSEFVPDMNESINERKKKPGRPKAGRTKSGRKVPGKYLTKNKKDMKKEIERYQGKDEYKTEWDADYKSGKGGEGKRYKTKKSAATKAYQKKYGNK